MRNNFLPTVCNEFNYVLLNISSTIHTSHQAFLLSWNNGMVDRLELYFYLNNCTHFMSLKPWYVMPLSSEERKHTSSFWSALSKRDSEQIPAEVWAARHRVQERGTGWSHTHSTSCSYWGPHSPGNATRTTTEWAIFSTGSAWGNWRTWTLTKKEVEEREGLREKNERLYLFLPWFYLAASHPVSKL